MYDQRVFFSLHSKIYGEDLRTSYTSPVRRKQKLGRFLMADAVKCAQIKICLTNTWADTDTRWAKQLPWTASQCCWAVHSREKPQLKNIYFTSLSPHPFIHDYATRHGFKQRWKKKPLLKWWKDKEKFVIVQVAKKVCLSAEIDKLLTWKKLRKPQNSKIPKTALIH